MISPLKNQTASEIAIFDRNSLRNNRDRAASKLSDHSFLINWSIEDLLDRLRDIKRDFPVSLQIGAKTDPKYDQTLCVENKIDHLINCDLSSKLLQIKNTPRVQTDEEFLPFADNSLDMVISPMNLHNVNDLPGALIQINKALKPDGLFIGSMLGGETLYQLRQAMMQAELNIKGGTSPRIAPFADMKQIGALMQRCGFALPVVDSDIVTVSYDNIFKLMHDLRGMGESNMIAARNKSMTSKALIMETAKIYQEQFSEPDARIIASFEIISMIGWAPHASQQQPLKRGSAKNSLAEALQTKEHKVND